MNEDYKKLPIEYPTINSLKIYGKRIIIFCAVIVANFIVLSFVIGIKELSQNISAILFLTIITILAISILIFFLNRIYKIKLANEKKGEIEKKRSRSKARNSIIKHEHSKINYLILNSWMTYFVITSLIFSFTKWHWPINLNSIINYNQWFLVFLLSFVIYKSTKHNKYIFLNLSVLAGLYAFSFFHIFIGDNYLFGDNYLMYRILQYRKFAISIITCITVVYISIDYLFYSEKVLNKYFKTLLIVLPINIAFYYNFLIDKNYIFVNNHFMELVLCTIETNFLALFFIGLYGYLLYRNEEPVGEYINAIVTVFFFFIVYDIVDGFTIYYHIDISLPKISSFILTIILIYLNILLIRKIRYTNSEFGKFYDSLIFSKRRIDLKILKKNYIYSKIIKRITNYLSVFPNKFFFSILMLLSIVLFIFFFPEGYEKQIIIALGLTTLILVIYLNALIKKRNQKGKINFF